MKIAVSASGMDLKAQVDPRFGRCDYLLIVNTDNMDVEVCPNTYKDANSGAGTQASSLVVGKGALAVLTGNCGPKAMAVFDAENIDVYTSMAGTVQQVVDQFNKGNFTTTSTSNSQTPAAGQGMGGGRGMGGCGGRGMGGGGGRGMGGCRNGGVGTGNRK